MVIDKVYAVFFTLLSSKSQARSRNLEEGDEERRERTGKKRRVRRQEKNESQAFASKCKSSSSG